ncbi:hypothetical protein D9M69_557900 [compost metagenome]
MQVGEEGLLRAQAGTLLGQGLLDLDDQLRLFEDLAGAPGHLGAGGLIVLVDEADGGAGPGLDPDFMPQAGQFAHGLRGQADPVLVVLDLLRHSDTHGDLQVSCCPLNKCRNPADRPPPNSGGFSANLPEKFDGNRRSRSRIQPSWSFCLPLWTPSSKSTGKGKTMVVVLSLAMEPRVCM